VAGLKRSAKNMKTMSSKVLSLLLLCLPTAGLAESGIPYDALKGKMSLLKTTEVEGQLCVPFYIKSKVGDDLSKANFRITSNKNDVIKLKCEILDDLDVKRLGHEDLERIKNGYKVRMWVPMNSKKYSGWLLKHDLKEGTIEVVIGRIFSSKSIEKKRSEYLKEKAEQDGAGQTATTPEPLDERHKLAVELVELIATNKPNGRPNAAAFKQDIADQIDQVILQLKLSAKSSELFREAALGASARVDTDRMIEINAKAYANKLSAEELKGIIVFCKTDAGKAWLRESVAIEAERTAQKKALIAEVMEGTRQRLKELKKQNPK
jgi:hypothetical protein